MIFYWLFYSFTFCMGCNPSLLRRFWRLLRRSLRLWGMEMRLQDLFMILVYSQPLARRAWVRHLERLQPNSLSASLNHMTRFPWTLLLRLKHPRFFLFWQTLSTTEIKGGYHRPSRGCTCQPSYSRQTTRIDVEVDSTVGPFFDLYYGLGSQNCFRSSYPNCRLQKGFWKMYRGESCCHDPIIVSSISLPIKCCSLGG